METIRDYLETMFGKLPSTPESQKAKADLLSMMEEKYEELRSENVEETEAVAKVIADFGNIDEVAADLGFEKGTDGMFFAPYRGGANVNTGNTQQSAGAYQQNAGSYSTQQTSGTYTQQTAQPTGKDDVYYENKYVRAMMEVFWPTIVCIYLIWSFLSFDWHISWVIWPVAAIAHVIIKNIWGEEVRMQEAGGRI